MAVQTSCPTPREQPKRLCLQVRCQTCHWRHSNTPAALHSRPQRPPTTHIITEEVNKETGAHRSRFSAALRRLQSQHARTNISTTQPKATHNEQQHRHQTPATLEEAFHAARSTPSAVKSTSLRKSDADHFHAHCHKTPWLLQCPPKRLKTVQEHPPQECWNKRSGPAERKELPRMAGRPGGRNQCLSNAHNEDVQTNAHNGAIPHHTA